MLSKGALAVHLRWTFGHLRFILKNYISTKQLQDVLKEADLQKKTEKKETQKGKMLPILVVVGVISIVAGFMVAKKKKSGNKKKSQGDPDIDYTEEDYLESLPKDEDDYDLPDIDEEETEQKNN